MKNLLFFIGLFLFGLLAYVYAENLFVLFPKDSESEYRTVVQTYGRTKSYDFEGGHYEIEGVDIKSPHSGEMITNHEMYLIRWNFSIDVPLTIALCNDGCILIASEVPNKGYFEWNVDALPQDGYHIQIWPERERVGFSESFSIVGGD